MPGSLFFVKTPKKSDKVEGWDEELVRAAKMIDNASAVLIVAGNIQHLIIICLIFFITKYLLFFYSFSIVFLFIILFIILLLFIFWM